MPANRIECGSGILVKVTVTFFGLTFTRLGWRERLLLAFSALHMVGSKSCIVCMLLFSRDEARCNSLTHMPAYRGVCVPSQVQAGMQAALCILPLVLVSQSATPAAADYQAWGQAIATACVLSILIHSPLAALSTGLLEPLLLKVGCANPPPHARCGLSLRSLQMPSTSA